MRTFVLNLGNTTLQGGLYDGARLAASFRVPALPSSGRELEAFLRRHGAIDAAAVCSVVPARTASLLRRVARAARVEPLLLSAASPHGLKIGYRQPRRLGADRVAAALGALALYPRRNAVVVDCGTATTVTALRADGALLGGAILPGAGLWAEALAAGTAQLPAVPPRRPRAALGRSPEEGIASGLFHGQAGAIRRIVALVRAEAFGRGRAVVIGTGGQAPLFASEGLFSAVAPDLVLRGLLAYARQRG